MFRNDRKSMFTRRPKSSAKTRALRVESLENRELLSATPYETFDVGGNACAAQAAFVADGAAVATPLATAAAYDADDLKAIEALGLTAESEGVVWNDEGRLIELTYANPETTLIDLSWRSELTKLDVSGCENLTELRCYKTALTSLDVSHNTNLKKLDCGYSRLASLNISGCSLLETLGCQYANLTALDVSGFENLTVLECDNNAGLATLDVSGCVNLTELECYFCALTTLDVSDSPYLETLDCHNNAIESLDISGCSRLKELVCYHNSLTDIDLTDKPLLETFDADWNGLTSLDVSECPNLKVVKCGFNALTELDFSSLPKLEEILCRKNPLTALTLAKRSNLTVLYAQDCQLTELNVTECPNLEVLHFNGNFLTSINVAKNVKLREFNCNDNQITELDLSKNTELGQLACMNNPISSLDLSNNTQLYWIIIPGTNISSLDLTNLQYSFRLYLDANCKSVKWNRGGHVSLNVRRDYEYGKYDSIEVRDGAETALSVRNRPSLFETYFDESNPDAITVSYLKRGEVVGTTVFNGEEAATLAFNVYSKTVTAVADKNVVLTRGVVTTNLTDPTYSFKVDGVPTTKFSVNKTWKQLVYSGGVNGLPARDEPYAVTVTATDGVKSASVEFMLTVVNSDAISASLSTDAPRYNRQVRATVNSAGGGQVACQWYRAKNAAAASAVWTAIDGATKSSYLPTAADVGYYLKVVARSEGAAAQAITSEKVTRPIISVALPASVQAGKALQAYPSPGMATASYQWYRGSDADGWTAIKNATGLKYTPQAADAGLYLKVVVTGTGNYTGEVAKVTASRVTAPLVSVTLAGDLKVGSTLKSYVSPGAATAEYQWYSSRNGSAWTPIEGATERTYAPTDVDAGKYVKVVVKGTGYYTGSVARMTKGRIAAAPDAAQADAFVGYDGTLDAELDAFWDTLDAASGR